MSKFAYFYHKISNEKPIGNLTYSYRFKVQSTLKRGYRKHDGILKDPISHIVLNIEHIVMYISMTKLRMMQYTQTMLNNTTHLVIEGLTLCHF